MTTEFACREIDVRVVDFGTGVTVALTQDAEGFLVSLSTGANVYIGSDADEALDAYRHPFARATTPNIFAADHGVQAEPSKSEKVPAC
jgi:hypothetical protein